MVTICDGLRLQGCHERRPSNTFHHFFWSCSPAKRTLRERTLGLTSHYAKEPIRSSAFNIEKGGVKAHIHKITPTL